MKSVIEIKDFTFRYKVQIKPTLFDINLTIYEGEKVLLLGPSGSGKSTLASCINGVVPFLEKGEISGSCKVNGLETKNESVYKLSECVGTVLQDSDAQFVGLSVGEDIAFALENNNMPRPEMIDKVEMSAKLVGMEEFLESVPYSLSGGQKQKTALAGVMHEDVNILIFDEPLAALDPHMGMVAIDLIDQISSRHNKTCIIIEHRLEDVLYRPVDRVVLMNKGRIVADLKPDEILQTFLLEDHGIRNPLFIMAMKYAGCNLSEQKSLSNLEKMELTEFNTRKVKEFFKDKKLPSLPEKENKNAIIQIENVSFAYNGKDMVLREASLEIDKGEKIAFVGKNGAGKTTMARLLCGFHRPIKGRILLEKEDYSVLSIKQIGERIGYVMQNPNQMLVKDIILEEVELALRLRNYEDDKITQLSDSVLKMCDLYSVRNWPIGSISYGQRKRVTIAAMLIVEPDTLILDEPTAGQDYLHYKDIMDFIYELSDKFNKTIIMITHDMHLAIEYTNRAVVFADGGIIADDEVFKILSNDAIIKQANLKHTSLYTLAKKINIDPESFINSFISYEREVMHHG